MKKQAAPISFNFKYLGLYLFIVIVVLCTGLYYSTNSSATEALIDLSLEKQTIHTTSGSQAIESYLEQFSRSLATLGKNSDVSSLNKDSHENLSHFADDWSDDAITGVMLVNKNGIGIYNYVQGKERADLNVDVSDRDYFLWAKSANPGEYFFGEPIIPREKLNGSSITVPISTPLFKNGRFNGALTSGITLSELELKYLSILKYPEGSSVFIMDNHGVMLSGSDDSFVGINYVDYFNDNPFLGSDFVLSKIEDIINDCESGGFNIALPGRGEVEFENYLLSHDHIMCDTNNKMTYFMISPVEDSLKLLAPVYIKQISALLTSFVIIFLLTVVFHISNKRRRW